MKKLAITLSLFILIFAGCSQTNQSPNKIITNELQKISKEDAKGFSYSETTEMLDEVESTEIQNQFTNILADNHGDRAFRSRLHTITPDDDSDNVISNIYRVDNIYYHQNLNHLEPATEDETKDIQQKLLTFVDNFTPLINDVPFKKNDKDGRYSYENEEDFTYDNTEYTYFRIVYLEEYQTLDIYFSNIDNYQTVKININFNLEDSESVQTLLELEQLQI